MMHGHTNVKFVSVMGIFICFSTQPCQMFVPLNHFWLLSAQEYFIEYYCHVIFYTRAVQKVSVHFEYLKNWSCGLDVTWQPVRGDLTAHS